MAGNNVIDILNRSEHLSREEFLILHPPSLARPRRHPRASPHHKPPQHSAASFRNGPGNPPIPQAFLLPASHSSKSSSAAPGRGFPAIKVRAVPAKPRGAARSCIIQGGPISCRDSVAIIPRANEGHLSCASRAWRGRLKRSTIYALALQNSRGECRCSHCKLWYCVWCCKFWQCVLLGVECWLGGSDVAIAHRRLRADG